MAIGALAIAISFKACYAVEFLNAQLINTPRKRERGPKTIDEMVSNNRGLGQFHTFFPPSSFSSQSNLLLCFTQKSFLFRALGVVIHKR